MHSQNCILKMLLLLLGIFSPTVYSFAILPMRTNLRQRQPLHMTLIPVPVESLESCLVLGIPTSEQYGSYWGRTSKERYNAIFESAAVTFLGLFGSYFLSFILGTPLATLSGAISAFWILLGPELKAYQRNVELRGGRDLVDPWIAPEGGGGLYGAYFFASVENVAVVEDAYSPLEEEYLLDDFQDYTMERDDAESTYGLPWKLRLRVCDVDGRSLQVHARMSEEYLDIEAGMPVATMLLSTRSDFTKLDGLTDFFIPDAQCWVGDYPYLNKVEFVRQLSKKRLRRALEDERGTDDAGYNLSE